MERLKTGFKLLGQTWSVVRKDPELIGVIVLGFLGQVAVFLLLFFAAFGRAPGASDFRFPHFLWLYPILIASGILPSIAMATVVAAAMERLQGRDPSLRRAFALALHKLPRLLLWTLLAGTIGLVLQLVAERLKIGGRLLVWLAGIGWAVATSLVIPVLMFEDRAVLPSVERSASLIKKRWGEGVTGYGSVAVAFAVMAVPLMVIGIFLVPFAPVAGIVVMGASWLAMMAVGSAIGGVFSVALYRYAADGVALGPFQASQLETQYQSRADRKNASRAVKGLRIAMGAFVILTLGLRILAALMNHH